MGFYGILWDIMGFFRIFCDFRDFSGRDFLGVIYPSFIAFESTLIKNSYYRNLVR